MMGIKGHCNPEPLSLTKSLPQGQEKSLEGIRLNKQRLYLGFPPEQHTRMLQERLLNF